MDENKERCGNCRFWKAKEGKEDLPLCRRFPGHVYREPGGWCGEWQSESAMTEATRDSVERVLTALMDRVKDDWDWLDRDDDCETHAKGDLG